MEAHLQEFRGRIDEFEGWLRRRPKSKKSEKWDDDKRWDFDLYIMIKKEYKSITEIRKRDYIIEGIGDFTNVFFEYNHSHTAMNKALMEKKNVKIDEEFRLSVKEIAKINKELVESAPLCKVSTEILQQYEQVKVQISQIPAHVQCGLQAIQIDQREKIGVVYVIWEQLSRKIIYVGSSNDFSERRKNHPSDCFNPNKKIYNSKLYLHIRGTYKTFDALEIVPIAVCPIGFEVFLELAYFNHLKTIVTLMNDKLPTKYPIDLIGVIYVFLNLITNQVLYVGSTGRFPGRVGNHYYNCYHNTPENVEYDSEKYKKIREIKEDSWPKEIVQIKPIERVPIYLMKQREQFYMTKHNTIADGSNAQMSFATAEATEERKKKHYEDNVGPKLAEKVKCEKCGKELSRGYLPIHMRDYHSTNDSEASTSSDNGKEKMKEAPRIKCETCGKMLSKAYHRQHIKKCKK